MAGSKSNAFETDLLELIFNNVAIANIGDASGLQPSATAGSLYVSLHTGTLDDTSTQSTSEATYTGYVRVAVARSAGGWTVSGNNASNTAAITFGTCSAGTNTITHFAIGTASSGAGYVLYHGNLNSNLAVSTGITPEFAIGALDVNED